MLFDLALFCLTTKISFQTRPQLTHTLRSMVVATDLPWLHKVKNTAMHMWEIDNLYRLNGY